MSITTSVQRVLLIDDDEDDCAIFTDMLKEVAPDVKLVCLNDSQHLFLHALELRPQLIFLDINLPGTDGLQSLPLLKRDEQLKTIPVIIYSSSSNPRDREKAMKGGASLFVTKPSNLMQIRNTLKDILETDWETSSASIA